MMEKNNRNQTREGLCMDWWWEKARNWRVLYSALSIQSPKGEQQQNKNKECAPQAHEAEWGLGAVEGAI